MSSFRGTPRAEESLFVLASKPGEIPHFVRNDGQRIFSGPDLIISGFSGLNFSRDTTARAWQHRSGGNSESNPARGKTARGQSAKRQETVHQLRMFRVSRAPGGRNIRRRPAPGPKSDFVPSVRQICPQADGPDASVYCQGHVRRRFGGYLCLPAITAASTQGRQYSSAKIVDPRQTRFART